MLHVHVFYNDEGELTVYSYEQDENGKQIKYAPIYGNEAVEVLGTMERKEELKSYRELNDYVHLKYKDATISIDNLEQMKNDPRLVDFFDTVRFQTRMYKSLNEMENHVTRQNKHNNWKATLLLAIFLSGTISAVALEEYLSKNKADDSKDMPKQPKSSFTTPTTTNPQNPLDYYVTQTTTSPTNPIIEDFDSTQTPPQYGYEEELAFLEYEDRSDSSKLHTTSDLYWDHIEKYATMYGLDPELVLALATQERGIHSSEMDPGGAIGLMQVQKGVWENHTVRAYNFELGKHESETITEAKLKDAETNIKIGCMILRYNIEQKNYHLLSGLLSYNMGENSVNKIISKYSEESGLTRAEILNDQHNCEWTNHVGIIKIGDQKYLQHVLGYMGNEIDTYVLKPDGERVSISIRNTNALEESKIH